MATPQPLPVLFDWLIVAEEVEPTSCSCPGDFHETGDGLNKLLIAQVLGGQNNLVNNHVICMSTVTSSKDQGSHRLLDAKQRHVVELNDSPVWHAPKKSSYFCYGRAQVLDQSLQ